MMHDFELHEFFYSPNNVLLKALLYNQTLSSNAYKKVGKLTKNL